MIVMATAFNYAIDAVEAFWKSLISTGYQGKIIIVADDCEASKWLKEQGAMIFAAPPAGHPIHSNRYFAYRNILKDIDEPVVIADIRDVIFQKNPEYYMPTEGVNVFQEYEGMTIGKCPYNSRWMNELNINQWDNRTIICAGITSGRLSEYLDKLCNMLEKAPFMAGIDQAVHNHLIYSGKVSANIYSNEEGQVYTVGHLPKESVYVDDNIRNKTGEIPCMVHQYDRHVNLSVAVKKRILRELQEV
jgi:hypothetical protein